MVLPKYKILLHNLFENEIRIPKLIRNVLLLSPNPKSASSYPIAIYSKFQLKTSLSPASETVDV